MSGIKPSQTWFISSSCNGSADLPFLFSERDKRRVFVLGLVWCQKMLGPPAALLSGHKMLNEHNAHKTWYKPLKSQFLVLRLRALIDYCPHVYSIPHSELWFKNYLGHTVSHMTAHSGLTPKTTMCSLKMTPIETAVKKSYQATEKSGEKGIPHAGAWHWVT